MKKGLAIFTIMVLQAFPVVSMALDPAVKTKPKKTNITYHSSPLKAHVPNKQPELAEFYPTALIADDQILTVIAGTPVVTVPYLGARPAFDGSDYIVNISSVNRDIRLMEQRRTLYDAFRRIGYPVPTAPILAFSGKVVPVGTLSRSYIGQKTVVDLTLGSSELDLAAALNPDVQAFMGLAYDESAPPSGRRVNNARLFLNMGFVNIGNLEKTPYYFTAGQIIVPFGRFSSTMVSPSLPLMLGGTKARPFMVGYKSQAPVGPYATTYLFKSDTTLGSTGVGGLNAGYVYAVGPFHGEVGASWISTLADSSGMQFTGSIPGTTFGGFSSVTNGSEMIRQVPGFDLHGTIRFDRYNVTAEWVESAGHFTANELSYNGRGAQPSAGQLEAGMTFMAFERPSSFALGYQWTHQALALNLPRSRYIGALNTSIWKDTVESIEYRHDLDYSQTQIGNGLSGELINQNTVGTGGHSDAVLIRIAVYF